MALRFENNGENQRTPARKKRTRNLGFYAALVLCAGAVVLTAVTNRSDSRSEKEPQLLTGVTSGQTIDSSFDSQSASGETLTETWYVSDISASHTDAIPSDEPSVQPAVQTTTSTTVPSRVQSTTPTAAAIPTAAVPASAPVRFRMPTDGGVTTGFSGDELIFCATMCDWRVHNGIDIAGQSGGEVLACADGIVENFVEDMLYGNTAIVRHADDSVLYYCGLSDTQMVSAGLQVKAGDVIGYIGEVPCELDDGPHVHLSLMKDGQFIDPASVLAQP